MTENVSALKALLEERTLELETCKGRLNVLTRERDAAEMRHLIEERFHTIFRDSFASMALEFPDGSFIEVNPAFCRFLGYSMHELMTLTVKEITHPDDWEETRRLRAETAAGQPPTFNQEKRYLRKDGATVWGHASTTWFCDADGTPAYSVSQIQDITERKRMQESLRELETICTKAFHVTPTMLVITGLVDGRFIEVNKAFERTCGWRREEVIGRTSLEVGIWRDPVDRVRIVETLRAGGNVRDLEMNFRGKNAPFVGSYSAEIIEVGGERCLLSLVSDITERKRAEEALQHSEMRYRAIVEGFDGLIYICSPDYRVEFMNDRLMQRTGRDATGDLCFEVLHGRDSVCPWCVNDRVLRGETVRWEVQSPKDNHWYYIVNTPIFNPDGTVSKQAMILDITELKRVEKALKESHTLLEKVLASLNEAVFLVTPETREILDCNSTAEKMFGYVREEMLGRDTSFLHVNGMMYETFGAEFRKANDTQGYYETEFTAKRKSGEMFPTEHFVRPIYDDNGKIECMISVVRDISEWKRTKEEIEILDTNLASHAFELELANTELEAFNYTVSHDLRKPLTSINGYCQILLELCAGILDDECLKYLHEMHRGTMAMNQLIDTLLNFSRLARSEMKRETQDLSGLATAVAAEFRMAEPERQVNFRIAGDILGNGDTKLLRVVMENLLGNAWKYTAKQQEVVIEFGITGSEAKPVYFIRDNGPGFDMACAEKLFIPFQRLHSREEFEGHGVGLATVKRIIQRHGGRVWAESEPGKGATFYFTL